MPDAVVKRHSLQQATCAGLFFYEVLFLTCLKIAVNKEAQQLQGNSSGRAAKKGDPIIGLQVIATGERLLALLKNLSCVQQNRSELASGSYQEIATAARYLHFRGDGGIDHERWQAQS